MKHSITNRQNGLRKLGFLIVTILTLLSTVSTVASACGEETNHLVTAKNKNGKVVTYWSVGTWGYGTCKGLLVPGSAFSNSCNANLNQIYYFAGLNGRTVLSVSGCYPIAHVN